MQNILCTQIVSICHTGWSDGRRLSGPELLRGEECPALKAKQHESRQLPISAVATASPTQLNSAQLCPCSILPRLVSFCECIIIWNMWLWELKQVRSHKQKVCHNLLHKQVQKRRRRRRRKKRVANEQVKLQTKLFALHSFLSIGLK